MIFESKILPRYAETDQMGVVHHSVYAIWYEQARTDFLNAIGFPYDKIEELGIMTPIVALESKYYKPAHYNEEVKIQTKFIQFTPVKFIIKYHLYNPQNELINMGTTTLTWVNKKNFKIVNIKKEFPDIFNKLITYVESDKSE